MSVGSATSLFLAWSPYRFFWSWIIFWYHRLVFPSTWLSVDWMVASWWFHCSMVMLFAWRLLFLRQFACLYWELFFWSIILCIHIHGWSSLFHFGDYVLHAHRKEIRRVWSSSACLICYMDKGWFLAASRGLIHAVFDFGLCFVWMGVDFCRVN